MAGHTWRFLRDAWEMVKECLVMLCDAWRWLEECLRDSWGCFEMVGDARLCLKLDMNAWRCWYAWGWMGMDGDAGRMLGIARGCLKMLVEFLGMLEIAGNSWGCL